MCKMATPRTHIGPVGTPLTKFSVCWFQIIVKFHLVDKPTLHPQPSDCQKKCLVRKKFSRIEANFLILIILVGRRAPGTFI